MAGLRLVGANPGVTLYRTAESDERVAVVSVWRVDWSQHGRGYAVIMWLDGAVRVLTEQPELGRWLADAYTRHFPETSGLPWPVPTVERVAVAWQLDLASGFAARAGDVRIRIGDPFARRTIRVDGFALGDETQALSNVFVPCRTATVEVAGAVVDGVPHVDERSSSAFLAEAEVWTSVDPA